MSQRNQPLYQEIADQLLEEIQSGKVPVGSMMPTEMELRERFGVSRHTVREAIRQLGEKGLLTRQAGLGTIVKSDSIASNYVQTIGSLDELLTYPENTSLKILGSEKVEASPELARLLGCKVGMDWVRITAVRSGQNGPIALTEAYLIPEYIGVIDDITDEPMHTQIERKFGEHIAEVELDLFADGIAENKSYALQVAPGTPGLVLVRRYTGNQRRVFEVSVSIHPKDRFIFSAELRHAP
jgi:DNA-binding GntR family transcriptional regulator